MKLNCLILARNSGKPKIPFATSDADYVHIQDMMRERVMVTPPPPVGPPPFALNLGNTNNSDVEMDGIETNEELDATVDSQRKGTGEYEGPWNKRHRELMSESERATLEILDMYELPPESKLNTWVK